MGHAKELITLDVYGDNRGLIADGVPEIEAYIEEVIPKKSQEESFKEELLNIVIDTREYFETA
jgi:hypothetical protein